MKVIYTIIAVLFIMLIVTFSLMNTTPVELKYLDLFRVTVPAYMLIFVCFLIGVIFTGFLGLVERFRMSRTINRLQKQVRDLKRELRAQEGPHLLEEESNRTEKN
ncbi:MAG: LapA family protein [Syntrophales bacterium]|nr:LapA family protein [Syntrophales bacterium]